MKSIIPVVVFIVVLACGIEPCAATAFTKQSGIERNGTIPFSFRLQGDHLLTFAKTPTVATTFADDIATAQVGLPMLMGADTLASTTEATGTTAVAHSPNKAFLLSIVPGLGQIYNEQWWKVPVIYGIMGVTSYFISYNYKQMVSFREEYLLRVNEGRKELKGYGNYSDRNIYDLYESYNQSFQLMIILTAAAYALNLLDAYVFGHLYDFQITDDISLAPAPTLMLTPEATTLTPALSLTLRF